MLVFSLFRAEYSFGQLISWAALLSLLSGCIIFRAAILRISPYLLSAHGLTLGTLEQPKAGPTRVVVAMGRGRRPQTAYRKRE